MNLQEIEPIIEDIVKKSLSARVYKYGLTPNSPRRGLSNKIASGRLRNSVQAVVEPNKQGIQIIRITYLGGKTINEQDVYAYWLVNGRGPGYAPIAAIEKWIREKKDFRVIDLKSKRFIQKNEKNIKSAAYAISKSMSRFGFRSEPFNFIEISWMEILKNDKIQEIIGEATYEDLLNAIEGI